MTQYFQLFRLPEQFSIDNQILEQTYRALATQFHPDKFAAASAFEQKQAMMMSATINQAYQVLKNPLERAVYLLQAQNINPDDPNNTHIAPEFLMQQMQWREMLMEARIENDTHTIQQLHTEITAKREDLLGCLKTYFDEKRYIEAAETVRQGRFLDKMLHEIETALG
ncbi:Fe-S protein assembly co-chaperone HscB [Wielerella bovis]|uniref:Fe-S protein assembly co-chaperone HscB n=1 Tax=Wielerella bovis TaxID=2917790 RepID=UPI002018BFF1|nr:Fe-S protein assembly co-chaperone HscB [Wielerella bovis]MCG7657510.1 Fe-S protein assembly co-chaperone HscB [Wielerella bovis]MCG7659731.1 Fe-S protein assembly co-chaperone HscB [Wielerella bovis]ULJ61903.1 Fe-S protein assembly co-chaperone HscB [Wielerella bovis]ULJ64090.1 Fe-S protein assembly co-chaperone HscB [Wielerella bovis]ULJ67996.1 Fe-S protein assembly co-chaperone HscB [Wielerella bovis]